VSTPQGSFLPPYNPLDARHVLRRDSAATRVGETVPGEKSRLKSIAVNPASGFAISKHPYFSGQ